MSIASFLAIIHPKDIMKLNTNEIISISAANQNFSNVIKIADRRGKAVIFKNNKPKYILMNIEESPIIEMTDDEKIDFVATRILKEHREAFLELAK